MLHESPTQALASQGIFGLVSLAVIAVFVVLAGYLSDKVGRRNMIIGAVMASAIITLLFPFVPQLGALLPALTGFGVFLLLASFYSAAIGMVQSVDTALTSDLVPLEEAGKYMGYANLAQGVANAVAPPTSLHLS